MSNENDTVTIEDQDPNKLTVKQLRELLRDRKVLGRTMIKKKSDLIACIQAQAF